jgi:hypothetical protein
MSRIKLTLKRISDRARGSAGGSLPPAGADPAVPGPDGRERRLIRQRLRRTRHVRDARVSELGVLVAEMQSRGRWNQSLVEEWASELEIAGREDRELTQALRGERPLAELVRTGLVGQCECGRIAGAADRFCAGCGRELAATRKPDPASEPQTGDTLTMP